ncbi:MAG: TRAP transporter small permease [Deltaproteobacteria bacterium]|nr:TRAP transporter small permease [Deltaproteobacteria bacterium]
MARLLVMVNTLCAVCGASIMLFIMFSISYGALTRTFNLPSPIWIVQVNEYSLVWVCFLATAWVLSENKHVRVDILFSRLTPKKQAFFLLIQDTLSTLLCGIFCYLGILSTWEHLRDKVMDVGSIDVPKGWILWVIPLGFLLLAFQFVLRSVEDVHRLKGEGDSGKKHSHEGAAEMDGGKAGN